MTTYVPILPITLDNILVFEQGHKIRLKDIRFSGLRTHV